MSEMHNYIENLNRNFSENKITFFSYLLYEEQGLKVET